MRSDLYRGCGAVQTHEVHDSRWSEKKLTRKSGHAFIFFDLSVANRCKNRSTNAGAVPGSEAESRAMHKRSERIPHRRIKRKRRRPQHSHSVHRSVLRS